MSAPRQKVCFVVSAPLTAEAFLANHIRVLAERYEIHLVANADPQSIRHPALARATRLRAGIERAIAPLADIRALLQLVSILRRGGYSAVHSITPKAGLIAALAGFIARVPVRIHTFTGQVWATRRGPGRWLLKALDRLVAALDTHLLVDSVSQRDFLRAQGVLDDARGIVLAKGSVAGVDLDRFRPDTAARASVRAELGIPDRDIVFLFVGRLTRDKGVLDLAGAFAQLASGRRDAWLVLVGPDEEAMSAGIRQRCGAHVGRVRFAGHSPQPERYMAAADVFCLPSYREGFGSVVIEAAAASLPAIGSRIYGIIDAIEPDSTGLLFDAGDVSMLCAAMKRLAGDAPFRAALAAAARERAVRDFSQDLLTGALVQFYEDVLGPTSARSPQAADTREGLRL